MIHIDGSFGEGGGQILRTSLALSMLTGQKLKIENIRAKRKKPGLLRQHLTSVDAAAQICQGQVSGNELHSPQLEFIPGEIMPGSFHFMIGTAGSTTLVLQTILPALMTAKAESQIVVEGGTHNPYAPPYHFFERAFGRVINSLGPELTLNLERIGFFPAGGGRISVRVHPAARLGQIDLTDKGPLVEHFAMAISAQISPEIGEKEIERVMRRLNMSAEECSAQMVDSVGPGNILIIGLHHQNVTEVFTGFGQISVPLKKVVEHAVRACQFYQTSDVPVGVYLADQLLIPMAMAGKGRFKTQKPSLHTLTNIEVIRQFMAVQIKASQISELQWMIEL